MSKGKDYDYFYFLKVNKLIYIRKEDFSQGQPEKIYIYKNNVLASLHSFTPHSEEECRKSAADMSVGLGSVATACVSGSLWSGLRTHLGEAGVSA